MYVCIYLFIYLFIILLIIDFFFVDKVKITPKILTQNYEMQIKIFYLTILLVELDITSGVMMIFYSIINVLLLGKVNSIEVCTLYPKKKY
jgi:hypothetical protein